MNRTYMNTGLVAVLVMALIISPVCAQSGNIAAAENIDITIAGSTTVLPIAEACASAYIANNPGSQIDVSGGGSSYGVKAVANGTVDIGTASRDLKDSEIADYPHLVTHAIARDGVAIVVNPANPVAALTMGELRDIYTGTITNWADLGGTDSTIVVLSREDGSGTRDCFEQAVLKPIGGEITEGAVIMDSNGAMRTEVSGNGNAIGYLSLGYVDSSVSAVSLDGTLPTIENIQSGDYAISRTLLMITNGTPDAEEYAFLDFVLSEDGQQIVEDENFIPVSGAVYTISLVAGWNMVSTPVIPADASVNTIFGDKITPPVYEYDAGYKSVTSLEPKKGYWVLANSPADIEITGTTPSDLEVTVVPGWNMIGPVSPDVQVGSFTGITPPVYGYDAGYKSVETLEQTKGYWVLASAETTLTV
jgi:phosphate transport system substrate-binding protein